MMTEVVPEQIIETSAENPIASWITKQRGAILSIGTYIIAHLHEVGYTNYFGIPSRLVSVGFPDLIAKIGVVVIYLLIASSVIFMWDKGYRLIKSERLQWWYTFFSAIIASAFAFLILMQPVIDMANTVITLGIVIAVFAYHYYHDGQDSYDDTSNGISGILRVIFGDGNFTLIIGLLFVGFCALNYGSVQASRTTSFAVVNTAPEMIVLRTYNTQAIAVPFDRTEKTFSPEFHIINLGDDPSLFYRHEELGKLTKASP